MQQWSQYERQIARLDLADGVDLHLHIIPSELLPVYFSAADLVALPYRRTFQSGVALAAYAYDRPVLATAVGGLPELIAEGLTGFLVPPDDPDALAVALTAAAADPVRLRTMGTAAGKHGREDHGWERIASLHEAIYREAVAGPDES
jgi:glycosyltransferase involved in cell wall biosynthesis